MIRSHTQRRLAGAALIAGVCWGAPAPSPADTIRYGGITYRDVEVRGFTGGLLVVTMPGGAERQLPLSVIESLQIDRYPQMGEADGLMAAGQFGEAADLLGPVFASAPEKHIQMLAGAKWVNCLDLAGRAADCVDAFIAYLRIRPGDLADSVAPQGLPSDLADRAKLAAAVSDELEVAFDLRSKKLLGELLARLQAAPEPEAAPGVPGQPERPSGPAVSPVTRGVVNGPAPIEDEVDALLKSGDAAGALKRVNELIADRTGNLSLRLYQRGVCEAELGRDKDAALAFMRVVVHFNARTSRWYVKSLIGAAESLNRVGQADHARTLLDEAVTLTRGDELRSDEHDAANKLLGELKGSAE
ncbi:MAG: tetratricopeptide repeat protein [Planctomycetota bacterium]|jgi:tetratricopeptide (TPR) repeat protein